MGPYALAALVVFGVNLLPAFGPPTWAVLVVVKVRYDLDTAPLVLLGGMAAASGRLALGCAAARLHSCLSESRRRNLKAAADALAVNKRRGIAALALFAVSPVPSAQLFLAAGLLRLRLVPLTAAFFAGRLVSYAIYVTAASAASATLRYVLDKSFGSPLGIALQVAMLAAVVALTRVDWPRILSASRNTEGLAERNSI